MAGEDVHDIHTVPDMAERNKSGIRRQWGMQHTQSRHAYKVLMRKCEDKRPPLIYESGSSIVKITHTTVQKPEALLRDSNITQSYQGRF